MEHKSFKHSTFDNEHKYSITFIDPPPPQPKKKKKSNREQHGTVYSLSMISVGYRLP